MDRQTYIRLMNEIHDAGNEIFSVTFKRRTDKKVNGQIVARAGELRHMTCRLHVSKGVKGIQPDRKQRDADNNLITVYEMCGATSGYKCVPLDSIVELRGISIQAGY